MRTTATSAILLISAVCSLFASTPITDQLTGKVIGVSDGDTIKILVNKKQVTIRLEGIDAPEAKQSFGTKSKQALSDMIFGREVTITDTSDDRYGRTLGTVMVDSTNINAKMIGRWLGLALRKVQQRQATC